MNAKKMTVSLKVTSNSVPGTWYFQANMAFESLVKKHARVGPCTNKSYSVAPIKPMTV